MTEKALTLALAVVLAGLAVRALAADSLLEAARRAGLSAETAAVEGNLGIALGSDSRTGERIVAVFRRGPDGSWDVDRRLLLCAGPELTAPKSEPPAPAAAPAAPPDGPIAMPPPRGLSDGYVRSIQDELRGRARQSASGDRDKPERNGVYLKGLVQDIGWIDIRRFGVSAACDAARIVSESGDRAFLAAALPKMEKDLKNSDEGRGCYEAAEKALARIPEH